MDIRDLHRRSLDELHAHIATAGPADLALPTPCAGWDLRALLGHLVAENRGFAGAPTWSDGDLGHDPATTFRTTADAVVEAFAAPVPLDERITVGAFGAFSRETALHMHLIDNIAHSWDVARTLGRPWTPAPDLAEAALATALSFPLPRGEGKAFAPEVPLPETSSAAARFLAHTGRDPR
ncbi:TIGR03086 family metal-binding protein [Actinocorallia populi]|uniref:TIGR03086 family metal-binding protein n=1 Tax=Actinocorallia populi TaxID=2079200 RepID=UPI000D0967E4|nr:TIGR03086 family metal-binding protein [Actinocorallia populi]